ncbi:divergent PAP2 family protein [Ureibacillus sp. FSL K6-8385]|uniref:Divergent PAP2 family protein n=1 Tax=Ureibacillus terrenus TaxID=118246 RepID=A0A540V0K3_9BACL|nr:divergent PAP2 family protein [Ureibacillus terrenus]MED3662403.1 divergent PAP2 family protein [Ureibacillus terrenus]MED3763760.1 divergent PAP2 family protein [Ureibacillus terrenus]TQE90258.1 divergent PAP2 family protein [Ureibacillus terrenus]
MENLAIFQNAPLILALFSIIFAQIIKVPIHFLFTGQINWSLFTSTGGMPSSHSAAVTSLATAVGYETGFDSPIFAVAALFAGIVMYDASGVRYQAGQHAAMLNKIRRELTVFFRDMKHWNEKDGNEKQEELKTLLGHKPNEVLTGAITGIAIAVIFYTFIR